MPIHLANEVEAGSAAEQAAQLKITEYNEIARNHIFVPLACEVTGVWCSEAIGLFYELGNRISEATSDKRESSFFFQRLSIELQKGNAACVVGAPPSFISPGQYATTYNDFILFYILLAGPGVLKKKICR